MMAIEMGGGVYCPLSPRDPQQRLHSLLEHTKSSYILVHYLTKSKFHHHTISFNIDSILVNDEIEYNDDGERFANAEKASDHVAYIIFTSGSTGIPKAVRRHRSAKRSDSYVIYL